MGAAPFALAAAARIRFFCEVHGTPAQRTVHAAWLICRSTRPSRPRVSGRRDSSAQVRGYVFERVPTISAQAKGWEQCLTFVQRARTARNLDAILCMLPTLASSGGSLADVQLAGAAPSLTLDNRMQTLRSK